MKGVYLGSQVGAMQFICARRSGLDVWFLGTDFTVGTRMYNTAYSFKGINNDSLNWSGACACSWTVYLYLKSGVVTVENCKIPTQGEANMINKWIRCNGFPYWTSTAGSNNSAAYQVAEFGEVGGGATSDTHRGVVPLAKISL